MNPQYPWYLTHKSVSHLHPLGASSWNGSGGLSLQSSQRWSPPCLAHRPGGLWQNSPRAPFGTTGTEGLDSCHSAPSAGKLGKLFQNWMSNFQQNKTCLGGVHLVGVNSPFFGREVSSKPLFKVKQMTFNGVWFHPSRVRNDLHTF